MHTFRNMWLNSERLVLSELNDKHWPLFLRLHTNLVVIEHCFELQKDSEIRDKFDARLKPWQPNLPGVLSLVISLKEAQDAIGIMGFSYDGEVAEVGYMLLPEYSGKGYATEALQFLIKRMMLDFGICRYRAVVTETNLGSMKVLDKCGFQCVQVVPEAYRIGAKLFADHIFELPYSSVGVS